MRNVGYKRRGEISHRRYNRKQSIRHFLKHGSFKTVSGGSGHAAGESWATAKEIDPFSRIRKYSKNSPSFDEGVYKYKQQKRLELAKKMKLSS